MARKTKDTNRVDEVLDDLLADCQTLEEILGESGLLEQLSQRLIERALARELNHLKAEATELGDLTPQSQPRGNSRNGYSQKTVQSNHGEMELAIPRKAYQIFCVTLPLKPGDFSSQMLTSDALS